jgi:hypothetical protein
MAVVGAEHMTEIQQELLARAAVVVGKAAQV